MGLDPQAERLMAMLGAGRRAGAAAITTEERRRGFAALMRMAGRPPAVEPVEEIEVAGAQSALPARLYTPIVDGAEPPLPGLVFFHGGGLVAGDLDTHDALCRGLAAGSGCRLVAVGYRLAPEHPFPAGLEDCAAAFAHVVREAGALGIDPGRIAVGGDSAGGNLAAVLALMGRDGTVPAPMYQVLLYPAVDLGTRYGAATAGMTITAATMRYFVGHYVHDPAQREDWRASPLRAGSLAGAPPALVVTCGHDPLRDEGRLYAARLEREGVPVTSLDMSDQTHGMLTLTRPIRTTGGVLAFVGAMLRDAFRVAEARSPLPAMEA